MTENLPAHTTAAVWRGDGSITIDRLPLPRLASGEVLVRVTLATICGSDRHTVSGRREQPCPSILGHESVGRVVAIGGDGATALDGSPVRIGQRVTWSVTMPCGECDRCSSGITAKCRTVRKTGHEATNSGWTLSGGYAEHIVLPDGMPIATVDDAIDDRLAAPAACATATVMAVMEKAGDIHGRRVLVTGAGMLGLTAVGAAVHAGASTVTAVDPDAGRRELAKRFGALHTAASTDNLPTHDVLLEFSGHIAPLEDGVRILDVSGAAVLAGATAPHGSAALDPESVVRRHLSIQGVHNYEPRHLDSALSFLLATSDLMPWADLVADPVPLKDIAPLLTDAAGPAPRYSVSP